MGLVDLRQVAAFNTMIRGAEDVAKLTGKFYGANGALKEMVAIIEDNLEGDTKKLTSAIDGLQQEVGEELSPTLRKATQDLTDLTNTATDNADAISEIIAKYKDWWSWGMQNITVIGSLHKRMTQLIQLTGMSGWREFSDLIGLTTAKDTAGIAAAEKVERLNEQLQTTLDLTNSNIEHTKKNIKTTEFHIRIRERELELIKEKNKGLPDVIKDPEEERLERELKALNESLAHRKVKLFEFNEEVKVNKKATDDAVAKIADQNAKDLIAADKNKKREELALDRKEFQDKKQQLDTFLTETLNKEKQRLI